MRGYIAQDVAREKGKYEERILAIIKENNKKIRDKMV